MLKRVLVLTDNQTDDSPPKNEAQLAAMVSTAMNAKSGDTWDSYLSPVWRAA